MECVHCKPIYAERPDRGGPKTVTIESTGRPDMRPFSRWGRQVKAAWSDDESGAVSVRNGDVFFETRAGSLVYVTFI